VPEPREWFAVLRSSHDRLVSLIDGLSAEALTGPSYDSEWTVAQVLSHLGSGAEIFSRFLDAGLSGGEPPGRDEFAPVWEAWNSRRPEQQAEQCEVVDRAFVERLESLDDEAISKLHLSIFGMDLDAAGLARMRLSEHAVHTWDIAVVLDPRARLAPDAVALLVDHLGQMVTRVGKVQDEHLRVHVKTREPDRDLLLCIEDEVRLTDADGSAQSTLELPAEALVRLVYGRLDPRHTPGDLKTTGVDLEPLRKVFPGL